MTRKKFVKKLMADGYSRNTAADMAEIVVKNRMSYQKAHDAVQFFGNARERLASMIESLSEEVKKIANGICSSLPDDTRWNGMEWNTESWYYAIIQKSLILIGFPP